jgi:hypothetical protein
VIGNAVLVMKIATGEVTEKPETKTAAEESGITSPGSIQRSACRPQWRVP